MPGFIAHRADKRLDQQPGHGASKIEDRKLFRLRMQKRVKRVDGSLLQTKTVLNAEETKVHVDDLAERHPWFRELHKRV
jgi:hypothetical protein